MWLVLLAVPVAFPFALVGGYYAYHKVSFGAVFCAPFGQVDDGLGWYLTPNAESCYGMHDPERAGSLAFNSTIFTDENGFRAAAPGARTVVGGYLAVGDSWTFGYGVDFGDSYPGHLERLTGVPVVVAASPGYGSAQAIGLAERWVERLRPRALIFLDFGSWKRSACRGQTRPSFILKPCYWVDPQTDRVETVWPLDGLVSKAYRWGVAPGGMLGAGEDGWGYFLISRPVIRFFGYLVQLGVFPGMAHDFRAVGVEPEEIKRGTVRHLNAVARAAKAPLIVLDPFDDYTALAEEFALGGVRVTVIGSEIWQQEVEEPAARLGGSLYRVPYDGHFGSGMNELMARLIARELEKMDREPRAQ